MSAHITRLQENVAARLESYRYPADAAKPFLQTTANNVTIPVLHEQHGDFVARLQAAMTKLTGVAVLVLTPTADMLDADLGNLDMNLPVLVQIQVNGILNKTGLTALDLVAMTMRALQGWPHGVMAGAEDLQRLRLEAKPYLLINDFPEVVYNVAAVAPMDLNAPLSV